MIVVSDTSVLSNLAIIEQLSLLQQLYDTVIIPQAVAQELASASPENLEIKAVLDLPWIETRQVTNPTMVEMLQDDRELDKGEAEAITIAFELQAQRLLIDERLGRREAIHLGLSVTGVLGVLIAAKAEDILPAVKPIVDDLITKAGFWVNEQLYAEILRVAGE